MSKEERLLHANELIKQIGSHGRRFFYYGGSKKFDIKKQELFFESADRYSYFEIKKGHIYFVDCYSQKSIYTHESARSRWIGFTQGGTLKDLVKAMRDYIQTGKQVNPAYIGPESSLTSGNIWGYESGELEKLKEAIKGLPIIEERKPKPSNFSSRN